MTGFCQFCQIQNIGVDLDQLCLVRLTYTYHCIPLRNLQHSRRHEPPSKLILSDWTPALMLTFTRDLTNTHNLKCRKLQ